MAFWNKSNKPELAEFLWALNDTKGRIFTINIQEAIYKWTNSYTGLFTSGPAYRQAAEIHLKYNKEYFKDLVKEIWELIKTVSYKGEDISKLEPVFKTIIGSTFKISEMQLRRQFSSIYSKMFKNNDPILKREEKNCLDEIKLELQKMVYYCDSKKSIINLYKTSPVFKIIVSIIVGLFIAFVSILLEKNWETIIEFIM